MYKRILALLFMLCALLGAQTTLAQNYPNRPITLIVPWGAGGGTDAVARIIAALRTTVAAAKSIPCGCRRKAFSRIR